MKFNGLKFLLLWTFAFWATGTAKFAHEQIEHHGRDASVADDDDDSSVDVSVAPPADSHHPDQKHDSKHPCPICQMLAGMMVHPAAPPALPPTSLPLVDTLVIPDRLVPVDHFWFSLLARGPPVDFSSL